MFKAVFCLFLIHFIRFIQSEEEIIENYHDFNQDSSSCGCSTGTSRENKVPINEQYIVPNEASNKVIDFEKYNKDMVYIPGGMFQMGSDDPKLIRDGEGPSRPVTVSSFFIDKYEVSNSQYLDFVQSTGFQTESERFGWSFVFDSAVPPKLKEQITQAVLGAEWWLPVNGSYWREPEGPGTDVFLTNRSDHPAVQISWNDAKAFCEWRGGRLPTEAEWEYAARGKKNAHLDLMFPWGSKLTPRGKHRANVFQGRFPTQNTAEDGFEYLSPVKSFGPQNDYGLYNMIGNTWEWVSDWFSPYHSTEPQVNPTGPTFGKDKVKRGGSFLCHKSYCFRYRTIARYYSTPDSATLNTGVRCARSVDPTNDEISTFNEVEFDNQEL